MKTKTFYVMWHYIANYSNLIQIEAKDAADAVDAVTSHFSEDFHEKACVYVFAEPPALVTKGWVRLVPHRYGAFPPGAKDFD